MKRLIRILSMLLCLHAMISSAFAAGVNTLTWVEDGVWYEKSTQMFVYRTDVNGSELVRASVCDGMVTTKMVSINADVSAKLMVYHDGALLSSDSYRQIKDAGEYVVMYEDSGVEKRILAFTIIPTVTNAVISYTVPDGFKILQVTLNNQQISFDSNRIDFTEEGDYRVLYHCIRTGMNYSLNFTTDFTGPRLKLANVSDGTAQGPVDISDAKDAYSVQILKDGKEIPFIETLTANGEYLIRLSDDSGNVTTYQFTILIYFSAIGYLALALLVLALAGAIAYVIIARKKLKVR